MRAPRVLRGQALTAELWNQLAGTVDELFGARDLDQGRDENEKETVRLIEDSRETSTVRITNPSDENDYVDVERVSVSEIRNERTAEVTRITWIDE